MKVRVRHSTLGPWYIVEVWRWWWSLWWSVDYERTFDKAKALADFIKNPTILEVQ